ncbi:MAG: hypothetical protein VX385_05705, partial [Acidobacteriota bacterium]|nr:hypothetical protein [Acidobacteriota bacterium]
RPINAASSASWNTSLVTSLCGLLGVHESDPMQHVAADLQQIGRLSWAFAVNGRHGLSLGDCGEW